MEATCDLSSDIIRENDSQNDQLMRFFVRDMKRIEKIRRIASEKEREILKLIIQEGVECGQFDQQQCGNLDVVLLMIMQGVDMSYLRDNFVEIGVDKSRFQNDIINFIIESLKA